MIEYIKQLRAGSLIIWGVVLLIVAAIVAVGVFSPIGKRREPAGEEPAAGAVAEGRVIDVRTQVVETRTLADVIQLPAVLDPWADLHVAAEKPGRITEMPVQRGDAVKQGDLLWRANDRTWAAVVRRAGIEAAEAEKEWKRFEALRETGAVSESDFDAVRKRRDLAAAALEEAQAHLAQCEVRSPITGTVEDRVMEVGEHAAEGQIVLRLVDTRRLKLALDVPEQDVLALKVGDTVAFTLSAFPGRTFEGRVGFVSGVGMPGSNAFRAEIEVDNAAGELKAGMIASARLVRSTRDDVVAVPLSVVVPERGEHVVFVVEDGRAVRRTVKLHAIQDQLAVLESGLEPGERVVVEGQRRLQDGRRIAEDGT